MRQSWFALAAVLVLAGCRQVTPGIHVDEALARLAPADAPVVLGIDLKSLRKAPFYQKNAGASGISIPTDMAPVVQVFQNSSSALAAIGAQRPVFMIQSGETRKSVESTLRSHGFAPNGNGLLTAPGGLTVGVSENGVVEAAVNGMPPESGTKTGLSESIRERMRTIASDDQIWFVSTQGVPPSAIPRTSDIGAALASLAGFINGGQGGLMVDSGLHFQADLSCASDSGAKQVHDALRGFLALGRLTVKDDQTDLLHVYNAIQIDQHGSTVRVHADLSPELSQTLIQYAESARVATSR